MDKAEGSYSSEFFERYGRAEESNVKLHFALVLVSGVAVVLLIALVVLAVRPKAIYYIPGAVSTGISSPNEVPKASVESFATSWLMNWTNFAPETIVSIYERSVIYMAPGLLAKTRTQLRSEIDKVKTDRLSSIYTLSAQPTVETMKSGAFEVVFEGQRGVYMGKEQMDVNKVRYSIAVDRVPPTTINPYGLVISDIKKEQIE